MSQHYITQELENRASLSHYQWVFDKTRDATSVSSWEEIKALMFQVESARNRYGNRSGPPRPTTYGACNP